MGEDLQDGTAGAVQVFGTVPSSVEEGKNTRSGDGCSMLMLDDEQPFGPSSYGDRTPVPGTPVQPLTRTVCHTP